MAKLTPQAARTILFAAEVPIGAEFYVLYRRQVDQLLAAARKHRYRKPRNGCASTGRHWHAFLQRTATHKDQ